MIPRTAAKTGSGISDAPALLKCTTRRAGRRVGPRRRHVERHHTISR